MIQQNPSAERHARPLAVATAARKDSLTWTAETITWDQLAAWAADPADHKECGGYLLGTLAGQRRTKDAVVSRSAVTLDADSATTGLLDVLDLVWGWRAVAHTTWRHTAADPRYRVVIHTDRDMTPDEYRTVVAHVTDTLGAHQFDAGSGEPERYMFKPSTADPTNYEFRVVDGAPLCVDEVLAQAQVVTQTPSEPTPATAADPGTSATPQERSKAEAVLAKSLREVKATEVGRNNTVTRVLGGLYNFVKADVLDRDEVDAAIWEAASAVPGNHPYDRGEFDTTRRSIWVRARPERPAVESAADDFGVTAADLPDVPGRLDDAHLAAWMVKKGLAGDWCWGGGLGWLAWDGRRWVSRRDEDAREAVRLAVIRVHQRAAAATPTAERMKALAALLTKGRIESLTQLMRGVVSVGADQFDQERDLLNVANGVVDLRTGNLLPHDRDLHLTKITETPYVPGATHPDWDKATASLDPEVADWMQVRFGQAATGWPTSDDVLPVGQGGGSNGKSTLLAGLFGALGGHMTLIPEKLLRANPSSHPTELMTLFGARVAVIDETPEAGVLDVQRIKAVLGQERMISRGVFRDNTMWTPTHSLFVMSNYRPAVRETDHGTWRRLALVRFTKTFPKDDTFRARIARGAGGRREAVLAWVVDGAVRWYANDRTIPEAPARVLADTRAWRAESDLIVGYLNDRIVVDRRACVLSRELLDDFNDWQVSRGHRPWADRTFSARFSDHEEVTGAGIYKGKPRNPEGLVRRDPDDLDPTGDRPNLWLGLRWRSSDDDV